MRDEWTVAARRELLELRGPDGAWGYRRGASACAEPTALAALALLATCPPGIKQDSSHPDVRAIVASAAWLASVQRPDGSIGVTTAPSTPGWMTPYALLLWTALGTEQARCKRACTWLLAEKGRTLDPREDPLHIAGHNTALVGWPWVADTHSWLEPTALAVLALGRQGLSKHPRVVEGLKLIRDREVVTGGWNYGNKAVFGRPLRAQPAPTGLALLTLSGIDPRTKTIDRAIAYLRATLLGVRASASLGWGLMGLRAWGELPEESDRWLAEAHASVGGRADAAAKLACLLLATGHGSLALLGRSSVQATIEVQLTRGTDGR